MRSALRSFFCLLLFTTAYRAHAQKELEVIKSWIQYSDAPNALYHHISGQAYGLLHQRAETINAIRSLPDWQRVQQNIRATLNKLVGAFPERTPLKASITRTIEKKDYRVENIVFQSQPGLYVTASLFIPGAATESKKVPAIIYCSGHSATGYRTYQRVLLNLVKKGFIVFAFDPIGQGERLQYWDIQTNKSQFKWPAWEHSYVGAQVFITGNSLANYFIWDGIRAIDYLVTRKEVDTTRIGITGRSGGGTQSAYIAAFDDRIKAVAPENYITNFTRLYQSIGPQDAEQNFLYGIEQGIDMADLLLARAPMPTLMITTTQDMFPIQGAMETAKEVKQLYTLFKKPGNFTMVTDDAPHASTKKNRESLYAFFQKTFRQPGDSSDMEVEMLSADELKVTATGQVTTALNSETVFSINKKETAHRMEQLANARKNLPGYFSAMLSDAKKISGYRAPSLSQAPLFLGRIQRSGYAIEKYVLQSQGNYTIPYLLLKPDKPNGKAMIWLNPNGKNVDATAGGEMEWFVKNGITLLAPDILGTGEMGPGQFHGDSYIDSISFNAWFAAIAIHKSIVGIQAADIVQLAQELRKDSAVKEVYALAKKQLAPALLHAAAFHKDISRIALIQPYASYRSVVMEPRYEMELLHSTVAASIGRYDLPDLAGSLAPGKLLMAGVTDASGQTTGQTSIDEDLAVIKNAYRSRKAEAQLQILPSASFNELIENFKTWIGN